MSLVLIDQWVANDHCLVKKVIAEMLKNDKETLTKLINTTTKMGWSMNKATICARKRQQHVGVYAGGHESYTAFAPMFDNVIKLYHGIDRKNNKATKESYAKQTLPALPQADAIQSTRIRTARNLSGYPFTCNMTKEQRLEIQSLMQKVFNGFQDPFLKGKYYPLKGMAEDKRKELVDAHYLFINDDATLDLVGTYQNWPEGRGIFINDNREKGVFIVWVGEEDQLRIMAMNKGSDVQAVWDLFYKGVEEVHKGVLKNGKDFVFDENLGYLSSCPTNVGTGMRASVHVNLPNFATKEDVKKRVKELGIAIDVRGTRGEATDTTGCTVYDISNKERLGSSTTQQINTMVKGVQMLMSGATPKNK